MLVVKGQLFLISSPYRLRENDILSENSGCTLVLVHSWNGYMVSSFIFKLLRETEDRILTLCEKPIGNVIILCLKGSYKISNCYHVPEILDMKRSNPPLLIKLETITDFILATCELNRNNTSHLQTMGMFCGFLVFKTPKLSRSDFEFSLITAMHALVIVARICSLVKMTTLTCDKFQYSRYLFAC